MREKEASLLFLDQTLSYAQWAIITMGTREKKDKGKKERKKDDKKEDTGK